MKFEIDIQASKEKVWTSLWDDASYRKWTSAFMEGSYAESDWEEGSSIQFLSPGGDGMFAVIEKKIPYVQMSFKHMGEVKNGVKEPKEWAGATENYYLSDSNGGTHLRCEMDTSGGDMEKYFRETFPKALEKLKALAEEK